MSEIANALKKIRSSDKKAIFSAGSLNKYSSFSIKNIYAIFIFFAVFMVVLYYFFSFSKLNKYVNKNIEVNLTEIEKIYNQKLTNYRNLEKKDIDALLVESLIKEDYGKFEEILKNNANNSKLVLKYRGIYSFIVNQDDESAKRFFEDYLKIDSKDPSVLNFLANLYLSKGELDKAYKLIDNLEDSNPNIVINKAIVLEKMGEYKKAYEFYSKALPMVTNSIIKFKIKVKIESLKMVIKG
ncbi:MAG: tetratricopeptide repeat protein [Calditerrivibrio sp.]|nr:tetratricopeptide repeat protein [Calditerrivibrio sp.]MCA1933531.1 tetratricopeptide repeat protein [Calditerrivibrio sp.]